MIPRIEEKLEVSKSDYPKALAWLRTNGFDSLYQEREVNSVYFDNSKLQMLFDAQEGIVPRRKLRIRYYGNKSISAETKFSFETKLSEASGRSKSVQSEVNFKDACESGIYDKAYGFCFPVVNIRYIRAYYQFKNWRVTLDRDILYERHGSSIAGKDMAVDDAFVLEIKASAQQNRDILRNFFDFPRSKFSKYERAFAHLFD